jgi:hypothetical protein
MVNLHGHPQNITEGIHNYKRVSQNVIVPSTVPHYRRKYLECPHHGQTSVKRTKPGQNFQL